MLAGGWYVFVMCSPTSTLTTVVEAAVLSAIDYKLTFAKSYNSEEENQEATSHCHSRGAKRVLRALLANGGEFPIPAAFERSSYGTVQVYTLSLGSIWHPCEYYLAMFLAFCIDRVTGSQDRSAQ